MRLANLWVFLLSTIVLFGCATGDDFDDETHDEYMERSKASAHAYAAEGFIVHRAPPQHPEWKPTKFYFKECEDTGVGTHISKTSYTCTYP